MNTLRPTRFELLEVTLLDLGALRGQRSFELRTEHGLPTNLYMVMGTNGAGKTTLLEAVYCAIRMLGGLAHESTGLDDIDRGGGGLQVDARVALDDGIRSKVYVVSIVVGRPGTLKNWSPKALDDVSANSQVFVFYRPAISGGGVALSPDTSPEGRAFVEAIIERAGEPTAGLFDESNGYPTVLYFPSDRGIRRAPNSTRAIVQPASLSYQPAHRFGIDGETWDASIDNLFVWFAWLSDGREEYCRDLVNKYIFRGSKRLIAVDRQNLHVPVEVEGTTHRIDQLSSGERQFVQLIVRIASHMTGSTIVLIDETEQHLHLVMRRRLINIIKSWAAEHQGLSFIMTSHHSDSLRIFAPMIEEPNLFKGGVLMKPSFKV